MNRPVKVAGVILAAGASLRMGRTKQLLPFRGKTILEAVVDSAQASSLHQVVVVLGHQAEAIKPLLKNRDLALTLNPDYQKGQSSSLKAGIELLSDEIDAVLFLLGDQPLVTSELIDQMLVAYQRSPRPIVIPFFQGERGNPVLFSRETFGRITRLEEDCGARPLFEEYAGRILKLPVFDSAILFDIDTEEDYQRLLHLDAQ